MTHQMIPLLRRFWPPALWREIELANENIEIYAKEAGRCMKAWQDEKHEVGFLKSRLRLAKSDLEIVRAENADLRRKLETQQRRDHRGRFVGMGVTQQNATTGEHR